MLSYQHQLARMFFFAAISAIFSCSTERSFSSDAGASDAASTSASKAASTSASNSTSTNGSIDAFHDSVTIHIKRPAAYIHGVFEVTLTKTFSTEEIALCGPAGWEVADLVLTATDNLLSTPGEYILNIWSEGLNHVRQIIKFDGSPLQLEYEMIPFVAGTSTAETEVTSTASVYED